MTGPGVEETAVRERIADLESRFGAPADAGNPLNTERFFAADTGRRLLSDAERMLDDFGP
ncbi:hypothetical protein [Streptomyces sp. NBC_01618]|uniref:hypothetical protein n=1 Tax=Streptomyces sp. NBC_01618 TaxID=2975900 RepID=UPI00386DACD8|nr:hypothetical protein OH735_03740 [Streptomyces sp. NBC_01618]